MRACHGLIPWWHVVGGGEGVSMTQPGTGVLGGRRRSPTWVPWSVPVCWPPFRALPLQMAGLPEAPSACCGMARALARQCCHRLC